jgi:hypothetical protein
MLLLLFHLHLAVHVAAACAAPAAGATPSAAAPMSPRNASATCLQAPFSQMRTLWQTPSRGTILAAVVVAAVAAAAAHLPLAAARASP